MSRKKTHLDEFAAMAKLYDILKPFDQPAVERMWIAVEQKLKADRPKPRVRRKAAPAQGEVVILPPISLAGVVTKEMLGAEDKSIQ